MRPCAAVRVIDDGCHAFNGERDAGCVMRDIGIAGDGNRTCGRRSRKRDK